MPRSSKDEIAKALDRLSLTSDSKILFHLPYRYLKTDLYDGMSLVGDKEIINIQGEIKGDVIVNHFSKTKMLSFVIEDELNTYKVNAFNQVYLAKVLKPKTKYYFRIKYDLKKRQYTLVSFYQYFNYQKYPFYPVYHLTSNLKNHTFIKIVEETFKRTIQLRTIIPLELIKKYRLHSIIDSLKLIHFPQNEEDVNQGYRTLKYQEALSFFLLQKSYQKPLSMHYLKASKLIDAAKVNYFLNTIPLTLTKDQKKAIKEIYRDLKHERLMYRLLVGDVGSGKTIVAIASLFINQVRGMQGVLLSPSEALARQHYDNCLKYLDPDHLVLLTGATTLKERKEIFKRIKEETGLIIVGTHALLNEKIEYHELGLVVIDEQHKFGVDQRSVLISKGEEVDLLLISATPIPRTLSLTLFGDIDLSTIEELPFKERKVTTRIIGSEDLELFNLVKTALKEGRQVFIVAPKIDSSDQSVSFLYLQYQEAFPNLVGLIHGKMKKSLVQEELMAFKNYLHPILISTSIIEVGIDIRSAGLMIVYHAELFGLSSLHQLRGRIGRDGKAATFVMAVDSFVENDRLNAMLTYDNGYEIAKVDNLIRGTGDLLGERQSGDSGFKYLNLIRDEKIIVQAKEDATKLKKELDQNPQIKEYILNHQKGYKIG